LAPKETEKGRPIFASVSRKRKKKQDGFLLKLWQGGTIRCLCTERRKVCLRRRGRGNATSSLFPDGKKKGVRITVTSPAGKRKKGRKCCINAGWTAGRERAIAHDFRTTGERKKKIVA